MNPLRIAAAACAALALSTAGRAADIDAGRAKVQAVCAACHGANGVSVSDAIPNLAGQRAAYLETQLKAWKDGSRKNAIMNAIGIQLAADEIANVAAYFASLPGAAGAAKSELMPAIAQNRMRFPEGYKTGFTAYHSIDLPATRRLQVFYANPVALAAARAGKPVPDGAVLLAETWGARLDADRKPITDAQGRYVPDQLLNYIAMKREAGWGREIPEMLRNEDWNYAVFTPAGQPRAGFNQAECLGCHKPLDKTSYLFTLDKLAAAAGAR